jgi:inosine/xanthosine triphosphate pyrophosphatase family protein
MLKTHHGESIVLASNNAGKVREINALLAAEDIHVIPQDELESGRGGGDGSELRRERHSQGAQRRRP